MKKILSLVLAALLTLPVMAWETGVRIAPGIAVPQHFSVNDADPRNSEFYRLYNIVAVYDQVLPLPDPRQGEVEGKIMVQQANNQMTVAFYYPGARNVWGRPVDYVLQGTPALLPVFGPVALEVHPAHRVPCVIVRPANAFDGWRVFLMNGTVYSEQFRIATPPPPPPQQRVDVYWHREQYPPAHRRHHHRRESFDWRGLVGDVLDATKRAIR